MINLDNVNLNTCFPMKIKNNEGRKECFKVQKEIKKMIGVR